MLYERNGGYKTIIHVLPLTKNIFENWEVDESKHVFFCRDSNFILLVTGILLQIVM